jgi:DNA-binding response OmpR family regulator
VEDHVDEANSLSILLRMAGCDTAIVHDGLAAVETAASWRPEAILLDIGLPRLDGHDACRRIRKQHGGKEIFIAAMTALGKDEDRLRSREAGFDAHLVKPVEPAILMKVLSSRAREEGAAGSPPS